MGDIVKPIRYRHMGLGLPLLLVGVDCWEISELS